MDRATADFYEHFAAEKARFEALLPRVLGHWSVESPDTLWHIWLAEC